jgi:alkaline phosphatase
MSRAALIASLLLGVVVGDEYHHDDDGEQSRTKRSTEIPEENQQYWMDVGRKELEEALLVEPNKKLAKNVILIIGDGMSLATTTAARIMKGQNEGRDGVSSKLSWEKFPHVALAKTYNVDAMVPDSAATAFAMFSGVKTDYYTMGYDASIKRGDPESMFTAQEVKTVLEWAQEEGMKTGIVTTARVTHATPAALYAKTAHRDWECDKLIPKGGPDGVSDLDLVCV